jgi:hypothetical protein
VRKQQRAESALFNEVQAASRSGLLLRVLREQLQRERLFAQMQQRHGRKPIAMMAFCSGARFCSSSYLAR